MPPAINKGTSEARHELADEADRAQLQTFTLWWNAHLAPCGYPVTDLGEQIRDGVLLIRLLVRSVPPSCTECMALPAPCLPSSTYAPRWSLPPYNVYMSLSLSLVRVGRSVWRGWSLRPCSGVRSRCKSVLPAP